MKNKILIGLTTLGLITVLFSGCTKAPQVELDAARVALEEATTAGADMYLHENYVVVQDSLNAILVSIEAQKSKLIKNYSSLKAQLEGVTLLAQDLTAQTEVRKTELKNQIDSSIVEVNALVEANRNLILEAPKGKEGTSALVAIKGEISAIEASILEANLMLEKGELLSTLDKVNVAKEKASAINTELTQVIAKYKANVKGKKV